MTIYTKGGDKGKTSLFDGIRVYKDSLRVEVYGTFDELNSNISLADKFCQNLKNKHILQKIEYNMFYLQGEIATKNPEKFYKSSKVITTSDTQYLEQIIDEYLVELPSVNSFILPGSSVAGAQLHVCRTVCRRAERAFIKLSNTVKFRPEVEQYINRLSDFLYIMARSEDYEEMINQVTKEVCKRYLKLKDEYQK